MLKSIKNIDIHFASSKQPFLRFHAKIFFNNFFSNVDYRFLELLGFESAFILSGPRNL